MSVYINCSDNYELILTDMKNNPGYIYLSLIMVLTLLSFITPQVEKDYSGRYSFTAPDAPEGSTKGNIEITPTSVIMTFDNVVGFKSNWAQMKKDSLIYETSFDLATVLFRLKIDNENNFSGTAVWKDGQTQVFVKKEVIGVKI